MNFANKIKSTPKLGRPSKTSAAPLTPERIAAAGTEHAHQAALFMWANADEQKKRFPMLHMLFAIPNGGLRNPVTAARLKAEGVKSGVPDVCLPVARKNFHGLFIEMKTLADREKDIRKGVVSANQNSWLANLQWNGYCAVTAYGYEQARDFVLWYIGG